MNKIRATIGVCLSISILGLTLGVSDARAQKNVKVPAKDGSGVLGYKHTPIQPWSGFHVHDPDRPVPPVVTPGQPGTQEKAGTAPSDSVVLFDGSGVDQWHPSQWKLEDKLLVATGGLLTSKQEFGDCQMHLEWQAPLEKQEKNTNQGNNGVLFLGMIEVQIFDSYAMKELYADGQAAAIYAQTPPLVNACREPGAWQTFDIVFTAPRFDKSGKLTDPARVTMFHNGLLVHLNQEIYGHTPHAGLASYESIEATGPVSVMAHHCPVRFRNIWIRPLDR